MVLTAPLLISGVRAAIQLYSAGDKALARAVRDGEAIIPNSVAPATPGKTGIIESAYDEFEDFAALVDNDATGLAVAYNQSILNDSPNEEAHVAMLWEAWARFSIHKAWETDPPRVLDELAGSAAIGQWLGDAPNALLPWQEFAVAFGRVALEFVGTNPSVLQLGGNEERLIGSFAATTSQLLQSDLNYSDRRFSSQILSIVLRSGLQTLTDNRNLIFDDEHVQKLVEETSRPILSKLEGGLTAVQKRDWKALSLDLIGPVSQAAFGVLAQHQEAFFGDSFDTEELVGALTQSFLTQAAEGELAGLFRASVAADGVQSATSVGGDLNANKAAIRFFSSALSVLADRPDLIFKGDRTHDTVLRELFSGAANAAASAQLKIDKDVGLEIARVGLEVLSKNTPGLITFKAPDKNWENVIEQSVQHVLNGFADAVGDGQKLDDFVSKKLAVDLSKIVFDQIATTPSMVAADGKEIAAVVKAVSRVIADDAETLISGEDWLKVTSVALREAGRNPGRLFGFDDENASESQGAKFMRQMMHAAADAMTMGRAGGAVLFGDTLRIAIQTGLEAISTNMPGGEALKKAADEPIRNLANQISIVVAQQEDNAFKYGAKEWLALWRKKLPDHLAALMLTDAEARKNELESLARVDLPGTAGPALTGSVKIGGLELAATELYGS